MPEPVTQYVFTRGVRGIFAEIYFLFKAAYLSTIFEALREGYNEQVVKEYLDKNIQALLDELRDFPKLFDPDRYDTRGKVKKNETPVEKARRRIEIYTSPFEGWSLYQVNGVYVVEKKDEEKKELVEEAVQAVRIIFRHQSELAKKQEAFGYEDVIRAILYWTISMRGHLLEHNPWDKAEQERFIQHHRPWPKEKRTFVMKYFTDITKESTKWIDDCALFIFGYLVRKFSERVLAEEQVEKEIWVTSFFDLTVNAIKRVGNQLLTS